jgi:hypothetical protein
MAISCSVLFEAGDIPKLVNRYCADPVGIQHRKKNKKWLAPFPTQNRLEV